MALLLVVVLLGLAAATLTFGLLGERQRYQRVNQRLLGKELAGNLPDSRWQGLVRRLGGSRLARRYLAMDGETQVLLNRVGWRRASRRTLFLACQLLAPLALLGLALLGQSLLAKPPPQPWLAPFMAVGCGLLLPKRLLALAALRRQQALQQELSVFIPMVRILFESGLTVEQALRVLSQDGRSLMPVLTAELRGLLQHVDSGLELGEELGKLARLLAVDELTDSLTILEQLMRQGGGAMASLLVLKKLLDDRRLTRMQEYISKLSAKMTIVMMTLLFPALLIVLGGPGMMAISRAMGGAG
ncbi:type II secretion system F family protein [Pseudomonas sp. TCU-HL1]|uniref:type II secretion system F family protein n=1 Tax=Pseudomonas sp. TCU-HL1 TaxID=1856685 RepID=UPI00083E448C|nr:type II secretion system F family protein [Pseudomonas sp. TCU-HL1]AOE87652.1 type II secretion system protein F [Pseudomonas sp. TCU-HL1]